MPQTRRMFLKRAGSAVAAGATLAVPIKADDADPGESGLQLDGEVGIVSAACHAQVIGKSTNGQL